MIRIWGLTHRGVAIGKNPSNPQDADHRVIHFLYNNNNTATQDTICQYCFGGDMIACNMTLKKLHQARVIAPDIGNEL